VGLCELVQHLSAFDYIAVSGRLDGRMAWLLDDNPEVYSLILRFTKEVQTKGYRNYSINSIQ
jgi:hypothetical protein